MNKNDHLQLDSVLYDWFTVNGMDKEWYAEFRDEQALICEGVALADAFWLKRFIGQVGEMRDGSLFVGSLQNLLGWQHAFIATSALADSIKILPRQWCQEGAWLTRVDIQVTVNEPPEWSQLKLFNRLQAKSNKQCVFWPSKTQGIPTESVYVGSFHSDRIVTIYEKLTGEKTKLLRFELRLKGEQAKSYGRQWSAGNIEAANSLRGALQWCKDEKLESLFAPACSGAAAQFPRYATRPDSNTDVWLIEQVLPTLQRRLAANDRSSRLLREFTAAIERAERWGE